MTITTVDDVITAYKTTNNINKILPARSKNPAIVRLRQEIIDATSFLPQDADLRQRLWYIEHNTNTPPTCVCGNYVRWDYTNQRFRASCSPTCVGNNPTVQALKKKTCLANHGVEFPSQHITVRQKYKDTMVRRYGTEYTNQTSLKENNAYDVLESKDELNHLTHNQGLSTFEIADMIGVSQSTVSRYMTKHSIEPRTGSMSTFQREVCEFIRSIYDGRIEIDDRTIIKPTEIDIVLPDIKIGIECDGLYWHSEVAGGKTKPYHITKTLQSRQQGYRLIHLFESDWLHHKTATQSRLRSLVNANRRIYARKCTVVYDIRASVARDFYNQYHIQGFVGAKYHIGLKYDDQLVACMSISPARFNQHYQYELMRFCTIAGVTVVGGANKLFKAIVRNYQCQSVISYCDLRWGTGTVYQQMGFELISQSAPNYWYFKGNELHSRIAYQKHKLAHKLDVFDPDLSEWENMKANGYDRIWDCGNTVWGWKR